MTNFSGIGRQGLWSWLTPERAVLVVPLAAGLGLSMALLSIGVTPLTIRVRTQSEVVEQRSTKAEFVPVLRQQLAAVKREQVERDQQLDRLLALVAGTSELQTFVAGLNDLARLHNVVITTTKPGGVERFKAPMPTEGQEFHPQPVVVTPKLRVGIHCSIVVWRNVQLLLRCRARSSRCWRFFNRWNSWRSSL